MSGVPWLNDSSTGFQILCELLALDQGALKRMYFTIGKTWHCLLLWWKSVIHSEGSSR